MKRINILAILMILFLTPNLAWGMFAREIMQKVNDRDDGSTQVSEIQLATCRYTVKNKRIACIENPRIKVMESVRKDFGVREEDSKSVIIIREPISEKGIGFLQYDYDDPDKDTDQWMYFSALGKVKRIISGNEDEPKTGSFFGTEISYEDLEARHIDDYTYKLVMEEACLKSQCWVIESIPKPHRAKKSSYSKSVNWIDKKTFISIKSVLYNRQGRKTKLIVNTELQKISGIWIMKQMLVNNLETKRITMFKLKSTAINLNIDDRFLTQRTLTDQVFREQNLNAYRRSLK